jgi:hypothetical protein
MIIVNIIYVHKEFLQTKPKIAKLKNDKLLLIFRYLPLFFSFISIILVKASPTPLTVCNSCCSINALNGQHWHILAPTTC